MDKENINTLLEKYLTGKCSEEERQFIDRWFTYGQDAKDKLDAATAQRIEEEMLAKVRDQIVEIKPLQKKASGKTWKPYGIAAMILLLMGVSYIFMLNRESATKQNPVIEKKLFTFLTKPGQKAALRLPDSSRVWLNGNSSIRYDQAFEGTNRAVFLDSGEAFFEIKSNPAKPFMVHTGQINTRVLGTSFNIQVQNHRNQYKLSINSGKVSVNSSDGQMPATLLAAGQQLTYNYEGGAYKVKQVDPDDFSSWIHNELLFKNASWKEVTDRLRTWYDLLIKLLLREAREETFTAKFDNPSLESVLKALQKINHFHYTIQKKEVRITN